MSTTGFPRLVDRYDFLFGHLDRHFRLELFLSVLEPLLLVLSKIYPFG